MNMSQAWIIISTILLTNQVVIFHADKDMTDPRCIGHGNNCYCDKLCPIFDDCCYKYQNSNKSYECYSKFSIINKCVLAIQESKHQDNCEKSHPRTLSNVIYYVPVYGIHNYGKLVFKNMYCALCNGVFKYKFAQVSYRKKFDEPPPIPGYKLIDYSFEDLKYDVPDDYKRKCYYNLIENCLYPNKLKNAVKLCQNTPKYYVEFGMKVYKNLFCLYCSEMNQNIAFPSETAPMELKMLDFKTWCRGKCKIKINETNLTENSTNVTSPSTLMVAFNYSYYVIRIISICSLIYLIMIYFILQESKSLAGKITIILAFLILKLNLVSFYLSIVQVKQETMCIAFALLLQFLFLSSFIWMSIFVIDLYTTMSTNRNSRSNVPSNKKLIIYLLIGFGGGFSFNLVSLIIQIVDQDNILSPNYGLPNCFINNLYGGIAWFLIPLIVCLLINFIVCAAIYRSIYQNYQNSRLLRQNQTNNSDGLSNLYICIKMSVICGIGWVPILITNLFQNEILKCIAGVLVNMQGLMFAMCFILSTKVRRATSTYMSSIPSTLSTNFRASRKPKVLKVSQTEPNDAVPVISE